MNSNLNKKVFSVLKNIVTEEDENLFNNIKEEISNQFNEEKNQIINNNFKNSVNNNNSNVNFNNIFTNFQSSNLNNNFNIENKNKNNFFLNNNNFNIKNIYFNNEKKTIPIRTFTFKSNNQNKIQNNINNNSNLKNFIFEPNTKKLDSLLSIHGRITTKILQKIKQKLLILIKNQQTSRILQFYLNQTSKNVIHLIFLEIIDKLINLLIEQNFLSFKQFRLY